MYVEKKVCVCVCVCDTFPRLASFTLSGSMLCPEDSFMLQKVGRFTRTEVSWPSVSQFE